jgi:hypothetical protein
MHPMPRHHFMTSIHGTDPGHRVWKIYLGYVRVRQIEGDDVILDFILQHVVEAVESTA